MKEGLSPHQDLLKQDEQMISALARNLISSDQIIKQKSDWLPYGAKESGIQVQETTLTVDGNNLAMLQNFRFPETYTSHDPSLTSRFCISAITSDNIEVSLMLEKMDDQSFSIRYMYGDAVTKVNSKTHEQRPLPNNIIEKIFDAITLKARIYPQLDVDLEKEANFIEEWENGKGITWLFSREETGKVKRIETGFDENDQPFIQVAVSIGKLWPDDEIREPTLEEIYRFLRLASQSFPESDHTNNLIGIALKRTREQIEMLESKKNYLNHLHDRIFRQALTVPLL